MSAPMITPLRRGGVRAIRWRVDPATRERHREYERFASEAEAIAWQAELPRNRPGRPSNADRDRDAARAAARLPGIPKPDGTCKRCSCNLRRLAGNLYLCDPCQAATR